MWVKICANTNLDDTQLAIDLGADAVGFVFAQSARQISPQQAGAIVSQLRSTRRTVERIGVFQSASFEDIADAVRTVPLTGIQLHSAPQPELTAALRREFSRAVTITQTLNWHLSSSPSENIAAIAQQAKALYLADHVDRILIDSKAGNTLGGTGKRFDWELASATLLELQDLPIVVAGGLNPSNVDLAIRALKPWGVDVASGVEKTPGTKDPDLLRLFMERVKLQLTQRHLNDGAAQCEHAV